MKYISLLNEQNLRWAYHLCLIMSSRSRLHGARSLLSPNLCFAPPGHASTKLPWSFGAGYKSSSLCGAPASCRAPCICTLSTKGTVVSPNAVKKYVSSGKRAAMEDGAIVSLSLSLSFLSLCRAREKRRVVRRPERESASAHLLSPRRMSDGESAAIASWLSPIARFIVDRDSTPLLRSYS